MTILLSILNGLITEYETIKRHVTLPWKEEISKVF